MDKWMGIFFFCMTSLVFSQEKINWMSMDEALAAQQETPKKLSWMCTPLGVALVNY